MRDDIDTRLLDYWLDNREKIAGLREKWEADAREWERSHRDYWLVDREFMELTNPPIEPEPIPPRPLPDRIRSILRKYWLPVDVREEYIVLLMGVFRDELGTVNQTLSRAYQTIAELRAKLSFYDDLQEDARQYMAIQKGLKILDDIESAILDKL